MAGLVIGVSGRKKSGKDTLCDHAVQILGADRAHKTSFAKKLKEVLRDMFRISLDISDEDLKTQHVDAMWDNLPHWVRWKFYDGNKHNGHINNYRACLHDEIVFWAAYCDGVIPHNAFKSGPMTFVELLQVFGTDMVRAMNDATWVNHIQPPIETDDILFVSDIRFENEVNHIIDNLGGYVIRLTRNPLNLKHATETTLDGYNWKSSHNMFVINNIDEVSLEDTQKQFMEIVNIIQWRRKVDR